MERKAQQRPFVEEGGAPPVPDGGAAPRVKAANLRVIENWVELADTLGVARSVAQIYGFLFVSTKPVSAQDCVDSLKISRSSAGQGLKTLKDIGAIRSNFELGERQETFSIEPDLGKLVAGVMEGRIFPAFETFFVRLEEAEKIARQEDNSHIINRAAKLRRWEKKLKRLRVFIKP